MFSSIMVISKRQNWVDIAKGIAIIAVVLGHISYNWPGGKLLPLSDLFVWLWHVPVFFMIGGFFIKEDKLLQPKSFVFGKIKNLYLLILYIYIPVLIFHNLFIRIGFYDLNIEYYGKFVTEWNLMDFGKHLLAAICFAGREPLLGAMWFVYVLFMALCIISVVSWTLKYTGKRWDERTYELIRGLTFLALAVLACTLTHLFDITIPRFNNTLVAVWLIYIGMQVVQKAKLQFNNSIAAIACGLIVWHSATFCGGVNLVANDFSNVIMLTVTSFACLYVVCYLSKCIDKLTMLNKILSAIGRDSFYIMGLHFFGFKVGTLLLSCFAIDIPLAELLPPVGGSNQLFVYYALFGIGLPVAFMLVFRFIKNAILKLPRGQVCDINLN